MYYVILLYVFSDLVTHSCHRCEFFNLFRFFVFCNLIFTLSFALCLCAFYNLLFGYLCIYLFIYVYIYFICIIYLFIYLGVILYVLYACIYLFGYVYIYLFLCMCIFLFIYIHLLAEVLSMSIFTGSFTNIYLLVKGLPNVHFSPILAKLFTLVLSICVFFYSCTFFYW